MKDDFYYLNVFLVGKFMVYDVMDCVFECFSSFLCFFLNLVIFRGVKGNFCVRYFLLINIEMLYNMVEI